MDINTAKSSVRLRKDRGPFPVLTQCVKGPDCYNCAFYVRKGSSTLCDRPCSEEWDLSCGKRYREDEVSVVFERVSPFASKRCPRWGSACTRNQVRQIYKHLTENNHETD